MKTTVTTKHEALPYNLIKLNVELPEKPRYYKVHEQLIAIIPKQPGSFLLIRIEPNKMESIDFIPDYDCKQPEWVNEMGLRRVAMSIFLKEVSFIDDLEISDMQFELQKEMMLNQYKYGNRI